MFISLEPFLITEPQSHAAVIGASEAQKAGLPVEQLDPGADQCTKSLSHDGTTAARAYAGQPGTAVVMMGTWMGSGYAPENALAFRPLAPDFEVLV